MPMFGKDKEPLKQPQQSTQPTQKPAPTHTPTSAPATPATPGAEAKEKKTRVRTSEFPPYVKGQSCPKVGKVHDWVGRGKFDQCKNCGASRSYRKKAEATPAEGTATVATVKA